MGEAKRRKQALGDRYGRTPPVLMPESEQLEEHTTKFVDAYFSEFDKLRNSGTDEKSEQDETTIQAMQQWVREYFDPTVLKIGNSLR